MERLKRVGLESFSLSANEPRRELETALEWLAENAPEARALIARNTREILWLEARPAVSQAFASTTFHDDLGATYLTRLALRYVPPAAVFRESSPYPLAENLYHEAIHQDLFGRIDRLGLIHAAARGDLGPRVPVPWRKTHWRLEHAFHAYVVYARLIGLRSRAVELGMSPPEGFLEGARDAAAALRSALLDHRDSFSAQGLEELA